MAHACHVTITLRTTLMTSNFVYHLIFRASYSDDVIGDCSVYAFVLPKHS